MSAAAIRATTDQDAEFQTAFQLVLAAMQLSGIAFNRAPTLYANLISLSLCRVFASEEAALKAADIIAADVRDFVKAQFATVQLRKAQEAAQSASKH